MRETKTERERYENVRERDSQREQTSMGASVLFIRVRDGHPKSGVQKRERERVEDRQTDRQTEIPNFYLNGGICFDGLLVRVRDGHPKSGVQNRRSELNELPDGQLHEAAESIELVEEGHVRKFFV